VLIVHTAAMCDTPEHRESSLRRGLHVVGRVRGRARAAPARPVEHPPDEQLVRDLVRLRKLARLGKGAYLGDTDFSRRPDRFLSEENLARLQEIRARGDPDELFCDYLIADGGRVNESQDRIAQQEESA
jgi:hypothetical protein